MLEFAIEVFFECFVFFELDLLCDYPLSLPEDFGLSCFDTLSELVSWIRFFLLSYENHIFGTEIPFMTDYPFSCAFFNII